MTIRIPGPSGINQDRRNIRDGTLNRQASSPPGPLRFDTDAAAFGSDTRTDDQSWRDEVEKQSEPSVFSQFRWGPSKGARLHQEWWFERRYPYTIVAAYKSFAFQVNLWAKRNQGKRKFDEKSWREVHPDGEGRDASQSYYERYYKLGRFAIDIVTPIHIVWTTSGFFWETEMYVEDVLGLQTWGIQIIAPSRKVKLATWKMDVDCRVPDKVLLTSPFRIVPKDLIRDFEANPNMKKAHKRF